MSDPNVSQRPTFPPVRTEPPAAGRSTAALVTIDGTAVNIATQSSLVEAVIADAGAGIGGTVFTLNLDHLVKLRRDAAFRAAYDQASYVSADGAPVVWMARQKGARLTRVTGADLVRPLCAAAAAAGVPIHFFGTRNDVLVSSAIALTAENPALEIAGMEAPPFGFRPFSAEARAAAERIAASGAGICFVALGAPKQETFANFARQWAPGVIFICIGAALDFIGGGQVRAPKLMQETGLEWFWRFAHDPQRLARRYLLSALYLAGYELRSILSLASAPFRRRTARR